MPLGNFLCTTEHPHTFRKFVFMVNAVGCKKNAAHKDGRKKSLERWFDNSFFFISFSILFLVMRMFSNFRLSFREFTRLGEFNLCIHNMQIVAIYHVMKKLLCRRHLHITEKCIWALHTAPQSGTEIFGTSIIIFNCLTSSVVLLMRLQGIAWVKQCAWCI